MYSILKPKPKYNKKFDTHTQNPNPNTQKVWYPNSKLKLKTQTQILKYSKNIWVFFVFQIFSQIKLILSKNLVFEYGYEYQFKKLKKIKIDTQIRTQKLNFEL